MAIFKKAFFIVPALSIIWPDGVMGVCKTLPRIYDSSHNATGLHGPFPDGSAMVLTCNPGYTGVGSTYFYCRGSEWAGNLSCVRACPHVEKPQNGLIVGNPAYVVNTRLEFGCLDGYTIVGPSSMLCREDGKWKPEAPPTCDPVNCGDFGSVPNGEVFKTNRDGVLNDVGSEVRISCNERYILLGSPISTCKSDGTWNERPQCKLSFCGTHPCLKSKCIRHIATSDDGSILSLLCHDNSVNVSVTVVGTGTAFCENNQWDNLDMGCFCDCLVDTDSTEGLIHHNLSNKKFVKHGDNLNWECNEGYKKTILTNIRCNDGQMERPQCIRVETRREMTETVLVIVIVLTICITLISKGCIMFGCVKRTFVYKATMGIRRCCTNQNQHDTKEPTEKPYTKSLHSESQHDQSEIESLLSQLSHYQSDQSNYYPAITQPIIRRATSHPVINGKDIYRTTSYPVITCPIIQKTTDFPEIP